MKRNQPFLLLVTVAILVIAFSSFGPGGKDRFPGYTPLENGSYILFHKKGAGTTVVDTGGAIFVKIKFKTEKDSVFMDINQLTLSPSYPMRVDKSEFKGDFLDIMDEMHVGDSASFFIRLDSLKKYYAEEFKFADAQHDTMQYLGFAVKVDSIYSRDLVMKLRKEAAEAQRLQNLVIDSMRVAEPAAILDYIAANKIKEKPSSTGVYYIETAKGKGANVKADQLVKIRYTGKFINGEIFDSNTGPDQDLLEFIVGQGTVIPGMDQAMLLMKKGGKATFIIPSSQAYGDGGGRMKPYATLIFDVELVELWDKK